MRRAARVALLLAVAAIGLSGLYRDQAAVHAQQVTLIYVGAKNCGPCRTWQREAGAAFRASAQFSRLTYREVNAPTLFDVLKDEHWPTELRALRDTLDTRFGVPYWFVVADDKVVMTAGGLSQWTSAVLPTIKVLVR